MLKKLNWILKKNQKRYGVELKYCYSYKTGISTVDMARHHVWKRIVLRFDIKDFFGSITPRHFEISAHELLKERGIDANKRVPWKIIENVGEFIKRMSDVCFIEWKLPVWSPSSPYISNIVWKYFIDNQIVQLLKLNWYFHPSNCFRYTRYADDLVFSTKWRINKKNLERDLSEILRAWTFTLNKKKTLIMHSGKRQSVLWLNVNGTRPTIPSEFRKRLRLCLHMIEREILWIPEIIKKWDAEPTEKLFDLNPRRASEKQFAHKILWYVSYAWMVEWEKNNTLIQKYPRAMEILRKAIWANTETENEASS